MALLGDAVIFTVGDTDYHGIDVVRAGRFCGEWRTLEQRTREGLACVKRARAAGEPFTAEDLEAAGTEFRYARDLIAAADAEAWLERWGLDLEAWTDHLRRALLRERWGDQLADIVGRHPVSDDEVDAVVHAEAICSGTFQRAAHWLAGRAAVHARAREEGWPVDGTTGVPVSPPTLETAFAHLRDRTVSTATVERQIALHRLDWVRIEARSAAFASLDGAREAVLSIREDGMDLATVAAAARVAVDDVSFHLDEIDQEWRRLFVAARAGDVVGPLSRDDEFALFVVRGKTLPTPDDPGARDRAEARLLEAAVAYEITNRVVWRRRLDA